MSKGWFGHGVVEDRIWRFGHSPSKMPVFKWDDVLSPSWRQHHVRHFFELPNANEHDGTTHIMLIEGPHETTSYVHFDRQKIYGSFLVFAYDAREQVPHFLHCEGCAAEIMQWLTVAQEVWRNDSSGERHVSEGVSLYQ